MRLSHPVWTDMCRHSSVWLSPISLLVDTNEMPTRFLQALQLFSPTRRLVVHLRSESRLGQYCIKMLERNESTKIVLCHISAILSSTSLCLTVWSYVIGASGEKQLEEGTSCDVPRFDGVGILAILVRKPITPHCSFRCAYLMFYSSP